MRRATRKRLPSKHARTDEALARRVDRTERVLGTLLTFLFARGITGLEDFGTMMEELRPSIGLKEGEGIDAHPARG